MLPQATLDKISIKGASDFLPEILTLVDEDQLPEWLGGSGGADGGVDAPRERGVAIALTEKIPVGLGERLVTGSEKSATPPMLGSMEGFSDDLYV